MSTDTADDDPLEARVRGLEHEVSQMNERLGAIESRFDTLETRMDNRFNQLETRIDDRFQVQKQRTRRWMYLMLFAVSVSVTIITALIQVFL